MKKTFFLLTVATMALSGATYATDDNTTTIRVSGESQSTVVGAAIAKGATLIDTENGKVIVYDENEGAVPFLEAPFELKNGIRVKNYTLEGTLPTVGENLVLDITNPVSGGVANWGYYLKEGATAWYNGEDVEIDYIVFNIDNADFEEWYSDYPITITGKFAGGVEATGYIVTNSCDQTDPDTANGGIVFFNARVASAVQAALVPEPTTATLSLLALAGLAARRRRK
ncbi:MAG: PEP-CTERM sorting domain-containing protein [Akkermansia sp.]|nr:PEP-CTERM sorting domain-containing protein [Akkermansia sp.]